MIFWLLTRLPSRWKRVCSLLTNESFSRPDLVFSNTGNAGPSSSLLLFGVTYLPWNGFCEKMGENVYMQTGVWLVSRELTEAAGPWDTTLLGDDDGEYFCRVLLASEGVKFVREAKMYYRAPWIGTLSYLGQSQRKLNALWKSMRLHIGYLRSLEESDRVRAACLTYLHTSLINFYPEMTEILDQMKQAAVDLGGDIRPPGMSWKYAWALKLFGWRTAKRLQSSLPRVRWYCSALWDETLFRLERVLLPNTLLRQSGPVAVWPSGTTEIDAGLTANFRSHVDIDVDAQHEPESTGGPVAPGVGYGKSQVQGSTEKAIQPLRVLLTDTNRWPAGARLAIGLSKAGCEVFAVCPTRGHPLHKTRAVRRTFPYSGFRPLQSLRAAIEATRPHIVIPCDDRGVQHLHELHAFASKQGASGRSVVSLIESSLGPPEGYGVSSARFELLKVAREEGLRVPNTRIVRTLDDLKVWKESEPLPWVLKADGTYGGRGVSIATTAEQATQSLSGFTSLYTTGRALKRLMINRDPFWILPWWRGAKPSVSVQSYIQGHPANCAVVCWQGTVLAGIGVEVVSAEGLTGPASVVRVVDNRDMMVAAERIARRLKLSGFFGLDFVIEDETKHVYLIEMNPRCTPLCHLQLGMGRDLIGALYAQMSGLPLRDIPPITENDLVAYFPQAWVSKSPLLQSSFQDIPQDEPDLVKELLSPWPDRTFLFRLASQKSGRHLSHRPKQSLSCTPTDNLATFR